MARAYEKSCILGAICRLRLPEAMHATEACTPSTLAAAINTPPKAAERLLRAGTAIGLFTESESGTYSLTETGCALRADDPSGANAAVLFATAPETMAAWSHIDGAASGASRSGFDAAHSRTLWEHFSEAPDLHQQYAGMSHLESEGTNAHVADVLLKRLDLGANKVVVDVGGGSGDLVRCLVEAHPKLHGVNFDLPAVVDSLEGAERVFHVAGSFFVGPIPEFDAALMRGVLREWSDPQCMAILQTVGWEMKPGSWLVVLESIVPAVDHGGAASGPGAGLAVADMAAMALGQGKLRTLEEFEALFGKTGMEMLDVVRVCEDGNLHAMFVRKV